MPEQVIDYRGAQIYVSRCGGGDPLLYLHSAGGGRFVTAFRKTLAEHFDVVAPDLPGFSRSPRPDWLDGMDDVVYFALDLMEGLGFDSYVVVGESLGGWLGAELAVHHPERIRRLVLLSPIGIELPEVPYADFLRLSPQEMVSALFHDPAKAAHLFSAELSEDEIVEIYENNTTFARLAWVSLYTNPKLRERLYRATCPTLLVWGENDQAVPRAYAEVWAETLPNARLEIIPECGHAITIEQPEAAARLVLESAGVDRPAVTS
jgi:pimeloyl-ACP methyl ester carboxylesterase